MTHSYKIASVGILLLLAAFIVGCAAGTDSRFAEEPAGFWAGLWHGLICIVTFVISLFADRVQMYEVNNTGGWYNFGFLIGVCIIFCCSGTSCRRKRPASEKEREWEEIAEKVEERIRRGLKKWVDESEKKDEEWEKIASRIEEKIKRELRDWTEED